MKNEITSGQIKRLRELYENGALVSEAAKQTGMAVTTARLHLKRLGVELRGDRGKYDRNRAKNC